MNELVSIEGNIMAKRELLKIVKIEIENYTETGEEKHMIVTKQLYSEYQKKGGKRLLNDLLNKVDWLSRKGDTW